MKKSLLWTKDFLLVSSGNFFVFLAFYALLVTLPIYAINHLHGKSSEAGLLTTLFFVSAIIIRPIAGYWLEKYGKKFLLMLSFFFFAIASVLYFIPDQMAGLYLLRFIHGFGFGMATTATGAIVAEILPDSRRGEGMGYFVLTTTIAMVLGPLIGLTVMNQWGTPALFVICTISSVIALIFGAGISLPRQERSAVPPSLQIKNLFEASVIPISLTGAFYGFIYSSILSFVAVYANEIGLTNVSSLFFVVFAGVLLLSRPFTGKLFDLFGENWIMYPTLLLYAVGMYLLGITNSTILFLLSAALIGIGWGTAFPSFQTIAIKYAPPKRRGLATATFLSLYDLGLGIGSFVVGLVINKIGFHQVYQAGTFFILFGIVIYYYIHDRKKSTSKSKSTINSQIRHN